MKFLIKRKKYIGLILIATIAFNFIFLPSTSLVQATSPTPTPTPAPQQPSLIDKVGAWAGEAIGSIGGGTFTFISSGISYLLGVIAATILSLEGWIIDYIINPANFPITSAEVVTIGWRITRDLANMFFILILLIIAFATVLKIQSYSVKQLLWKVVIAALLINFSLVIAGLVIDFTNILTASFLNQITGDGFGTITTRLAQGMQILNLYNPAKATNIGEGVMQFAAGGIAACVGIVLTLIGLVVTVFVFGATAIFLMVRIIYLWGLLIFAPIVWMLWILPATKGYWSKWWDNFIKWAFFAPIYVFLIYLSLQIFDASGKLNTKFLGVSLPASWNSAAPGFTTVAMPAAIFQWILVIAMMFGSLIVAQKFGVMGAQGARATLTGWGTGAKNWAGRYARRKATGWTQPLPESAPPPTGIRGFLRKAGAGLGRAAVKVPGVRGAYLGMAATTQKDYDEAYNKYKNVDPAVLEQIEKSPILPEARYQLAIKQILMEKKKFKPNAEQLMPILDQAKRYNKEEDFLKIVADKMGSDLTTANGYNTNQREELIRRAKNNNVEKEFSKLLPVVAAKILKKSVEEIVGKIEKASDIIEDQLTSDVIKALSSDQLRDVARRGGDAKIQKVKSVINAEFGALDQATQNLIKNEILSKTKQVVEIDPEGKQITKQVSISKEMRNSALRELAEQNPNAEKIARSKFVTSSPAWEI